MTLILFIILSVIVFGIVFLFSIAKGISSLLGKTSYSENRSAHNNSSEEYASGTQSHTKKVFSENEGEYVKYEEIKD